jgi:TonB family protein
MIASSRLCLTAGFMLIEALTAFAGDVKVIANPSVRTSSISIAELRTVFLLQRKTLKEGSSVEPVLGRNGVTTEAFMKRYLKRDSEEVRTYYQGLVFTGKGSMPKQLNSDAEIVAYVARTKGAIGYVSSDSNTDQVKVLAVTEDAIPQRTLVKRIEPEYPETLQRLGIGGSVRLEVTISPKGAVESVAVLGGNPILAETAAKAAKQWLYSASSSSTKIEIVVPFDPHH